VQNNEICSQPKQKRAYQAQPELNFANYFTQSAKWDIYVYIEQVTSRNFKTNFKHHKIGQPNC